MVIGAAMVPGVAATPDVSPPAEAGPRLLVLAPSYPFPPRDGVMLRLGNLLRRLPPGWSIDLVCPDRVPAPEETPLPAPLIGVCVRAPLDPAPVGWRASTFAQVWRREASIIWKFRSAALAIEVRRRARDAAGVLAVGLQMAQYLEEVPAHIPMAVDNYNVESLILDRLADTRTGPRRLYWRREAAKLRRTEERLLQRAGHVWAISEVDRRAMISLTGASRLTTVPMGIDLEYFQSSQAPPAGPPRFTFVGAFGWHVNDDAAAWFVGSVWPRVRAAIPAAECYLVGRNPGAPVRELGRGPGVTVTGTVDDVRPYLAASTAVVVPLRYGSGVRTKILEAFAAGRPVVSTAVGAEGLDVRPDEHLLLADDAESFADACLRVAREAHTAARMVERARDYVAAQDRQATLLLQEAFQAAFMSGRQP